MEMWGRPFGAPLCIAADLETGLQAGLARYANFSGVKLRASAGQAHWQQGVIERHGQWFQDILRRVIDEKSIDEEDIDLAIAHTTQAKNELRRRHGYSPCQAVFGKDPRSPEELLAGNDEEQVLELLTADRKRQREMAVRTAARVASFRSQVDVKLRKGLIQKARVKRGEYAIGEMVCFYRLDKAGTTSKRGRWRGPGLILGQEGGNWWISYAGRCHLVAEEHMRPSTAEELGDLFASRVARSDLEKLLFSDPNDPTVYSGPDHLDQAEPGDEDQAMNEDDLDEDVPMGHQLPEGDLLPGGPLDRDTKTGNLPGVQVPTERHHADGGRRQRPEASRMKPLCSRSAKHSGPSRSSSKRSCPGV